MIYIEKTNEYLADIYLYLYPTGSRREAFEHGVHAFDGGIHERCRLRYDGEAGDQSCHFARYALGGLPGGLAL